MQIAIVGAGYTGGEADQLRRDMAAWKKHGRLERHRDASLEGFAKNGISEAFAEASTSRSRASASTASPRATPRASRCSSTSSAWLKVHHPAAFACALLNSQPMGFYSAVEHRRGRQTPRSAPRRRAA
jgi:error-prone DNA polymerase